MTNRRLVEIAALIIVTVIAPSSAQEPLAKALDVGVNGRSMHLWSDGLESRVPGQPVVILEAGGQGTVEAWRSIFTRIGRLAPAIAYDRSGLGKSEFDGERPTVAHVAENLHALLAAAHRAPLRACRTLMGWRVRSRIYDPVSEGSRRVGLPGRDGL